LFCCFILILVWRADALLPPADSNVRTAFALSVGVVYWALALIPHLAITTFMAKFAGGDPVVDVFQPPLIKLMSGSVAEARWESAIAITFAVLLYVPR